MGVTDTEKTWSLAGVEVTQALMWKPEATRSLINPGTLMEVWLDFQEARAPVLRIMGNAMLGGSGLALELFLCNLKDPPAAADKPKWAIA